VTTTDVNPLIVCVEVDNQSVVQVIVADIFKLL